MEPGVDPNRLDELFSRIKSIPNVEIKMHENGVFLAKGNIPVSTFDDFLVANPLDLSYQKDNEK